MARWIRFFSSYARDREEALRRDHTHPRLVLSRAEKSQRVPVDPLIKIRSQRPAFFHAWGFVLVHWVLQALSAITVRKSTCVIRHLLTFPFFFLVYAKDSVRFSETRRGGKIQSACAKSGEFRGCLLISSAISPHRRFVPTMSGDFARLL